MPYSFNMLVVNYRACANVSKSQSSDAFWFSHHCHLCSIYLVRERKYFNVTLSSMDGIWMFLVKYILQAAVRLTATGITNNKANDI